MDSNIEKGMKALLYNFWVTKDENQELYYQIKHNQNELKDFISKNLGSNLIVHDRFIKLEKIPTVLKENGKIENFSSILDYIMLLLLLMFLEDKTKGDLFILSNLIDYIKNTAITLELDHIPDWNKVSDRRGLINAINFLKSIHVIHAKDEGKINFTDNKDAEALYETMGISNYVMRIFDCEINNLRTPEDFIRSEFLSQDEQKGDARRYRVFRNILYMPTTFSKNLSVTDLDYIKKNRMYIQNEITRKLNMNVEITHNMALLLDDVNSIEKDNFPNTKKVTEIVLMVNHKILEDIRSQKILLDNFEVATVKESYLEKVIKDIKKDKEPYIGKTLANLTEDKFYKEVFEYMEKYNFVERVAEDIIIYPVVGRLVGKTKEIKKEKIETIETISLFGGYDEL